ncbi:uncharacterized protein BX664DRAFT_342531 [Halteromyces radiatus]|uniref:uncharacterized protein n=1 Tax=Halteromyces radiatus TaxID=101107 RepID=UPI0022207AC4|nr:uncharacterized protein BX664DRAFT_342531 [Halteromyces radiatus]KAI8078713.1 hypothetical protein BX664DRAFT_342531 [Halteromyces radiatus]
MTESIDEAELAAMTQPELQHYLDSLFEQALDIIQQSHQWPIFRQDDTITTRRQRLPPTQQQGTTLNRKTTSSSRHYFIQRHSEHADITYDQIRQVLFENHSMNEPKYVVMLEEAKQLKLLVKDTTTEAGIYWLGFKASMASPREFVELVATRELPNTHSFLVVSQPVATKEYAKKSYVRGKYLSWEYVSEKQQQMDSDSKIVEWTCVQQSSAGGWVPGFLSDWIASREFHKDVDSLINYIKGTK